MWMIEWTTSIQMPGSKRKDESLVVGALRPPIIPKFSQVLARLRGEIGEVWRAQKSGQAKEERLDSIASRAQVMER
jgi:hypothetical protein